MGLAVTKTPMGPPPNGLGETVVIEPKLGRRRAAVTGPEPRLKASGEVSGEVQQPSELPASRALTHRAAPEVSEAVDVVTDETRPIHRLVTRTKDKLARSSKPGLIEVSGKGLFTVTATAIQAERVGRVLTAIVEAVQAQGWRVLNDEGGMRLEPDGEPLGLSLSEQMDKVRHQPTEAEQAALRRHEEAKQKAQRLGRWFSDWDRPKIPEWDHIPNGQLVLNLEMGLYRQDRIRRKFSDGKTQRLEGLVDQVIEALAAYAASEKATRERHERERIEAAERQRLWNEAKRRQELDDKRYEFLQAQMKRLARVQEIEAFVSEMSQQGEAEGAVAAFLDWSARLASDIRANLSFERLGEKLARNDLMNDEAKVGSWINVDQA